MRFTEKWAWQKQTKVVAGTYGRDRESKDGVCFRDVVHIDSGLNPWMRDYRKELRAIDTDKKASEAIIDYWQMVAAEWDMGNGIIKL